MATEEAVEHDCCPHADGAGHHGKTSKAGQTCHCCSMGILFPVSLTGLPAQEPAAAVHYPNVARFKLSPDPAATWRPPTSF